MKTARTVLGFALLTGLASSANAQWTTSGSNIYYNTGNVGIFTTSPTYHLHVIESSTTNGARAIYGLANGASGVTNGVYGQTTSPDGRGVIGLASSTTGANFGIYGHSSSSTGHGVFGLAQNDTGVNYGVYGKSTSDSGYGVCGYAQVTDGVGSGVQGESASVVGLGVSGLVSNTGGTTESNAGVLGQSNSTSSNAFGVFANGRLGASGTKSFCIDHPLDPENKFLFHYSMESPEVLNVYSGNVVLDGVGSAVIELPAYFAAINVDPRYALTAVGAPMPLLHVAAEIPAWALEKGAQAAADNWVPTCSFTIAGGAAGGKVSWRVEAVRSDRWVRTNGAPVESEKPAADRGLFLQPSLYGAGQDRAIFFRPGAMAQANPNE